MAKKDYYDILGVTKSASKDEIKKAFHKLAHKFHPDKSGGDDSKFKEVNEAYQTLSDESKRAQYDQFGQAYEGQGSGFGGQSGGYGFSGFQNAQGFDMGDLNDIFSEFLVVVWVAVEIKLDEAEIFLQKSLFHLKKAFSV